MIQVMSSQFGDFKLEPPNSLSAPACVRQGGQVYSKLRS